MLDVSLHASPQAVYNFCLTSYVASDSISDSILYSHQVHGAVVTYVGVSIDHLKLLATPRWRPSDPVNCENLKSHI